MNQDKCITKKFYRSVLNPFTFEKEDLEIAIGATEEQLSGINEMFGSYNAAEMMLQKNAVEQLNSQEEQFRIECAEKYCIENATEHITASTNVDEMITSLLLFSENCEQPVAVTTNIDMLGLFSDMFNIKKLNVTLGKTNIGPKMILEHFTVKNKKDIDISFRINIEKQQKPESKIDVPVLLYDEKDITNCRQFIYHFEDFYSLKSDINIKLDQLLSDGILSASQS